ncbi:MAG: hypothetical protein E6Q24_04990 [Chitinophagaceae bacterium]|nr:MAG: hypothetical protein E6Q24_04990 [Chitinophagaceae bacterium]
MNFILPWFPLLGVIIAGYFAVLQIRLNNITNARIKWLDTLKEQLAGFNSEIFELTMNKAVVKTIEELESQGLHSDQAGAFADAVGNGLIDQLKKIQHKFDSIRLNLNPKEDLHIAVLRVMDVLMGLLNQIPNTPFKKQKNLTRDITDCTDQLVLIARLIFKLEWEKIKQNRFQRFYYSRYCQGASIHDEILVIAKETSAKYSANETRE